MFDILIMEANEIHHFSFSFDKVLYMFRKSALSIIRSISSLYIRNSYLLRVYSDEIILMMDSGTVRNIWNTLSNKYEK